MSDIPQNAIEAGIEAWAEYDDDHSPDTYRGADLITAILEAAEKAWPHDKPSRDPASTTYGNFEHTYHHVQKERAGARAERPFGFGVTK